MKSSNHAPQKRGGIYKIKPIYKLNGYNGN